VLLATSDFWFWETPSWGWSQAWALAVLLFVSFIPVAVPRKRDELGRGEATRLAPLFVALVNGRDGRWSTSKTNAVLWTYAVWYAFITILLYTGGKGLEHSILKQQYLVLMGFPVATAVIARGITQSKVETGKIVTKQPDGAETNPINGVAQLVTNDTGQPDLLDFQYFGFNLILLAYFFTQFVGHKQGFDLPNLPESLIALTGVSAAGYVGKKGVQKDTDPVITAIDPPSAAARDTIVVHGGNLVTAGERDVSVQIGDVTATGVTVEGDDPAAKITATIPPGVAAGPVAVRVVNYRGVTSDPYSYTIKATAPAPDG
jgi:IPT/TIG domain-containing protein